MRHIKPYPVITGSLITATSLLSLFPAPSTARLQVQNAPVAPPSLSTLIAKEYPGDSRRVMEQASEITLYSIDPRLIEDDPVADKAKRKAETFDSFTVLGKVTVSGAEKRDVIAAMDVDLQETLPGGSRCYQPRHGIRARDAQTGKTVNITICFSCTRAFIVATDGKRQEFHAFGPALYKVLARLFYKYRIPVAPKLSARPQPG